MSDYKKVIQLQFDYSQMSSSVTEVTRKMGLLDAEFKNAKESAKSYADENTQLELEIQHLSEKINLQSQRVKLNKEALDNATKSGELNKSQMDKIRKEYLNSESQLIKLNNALNDSKEKLYNATEGAGSYKTKLNELDQQIKTIEATEKLNSEQLKSNATEAEKLSSAIKTLSEKISIQEQKVNLSKEAFDKATESGKSNEQELERLKQQYINNQTQLVQMNNNLDDCKQKLNGVNEPAQQLGEKLDKSGESAVDIASKLYIVQEALQKVKEGLMAYVDFDESMAKVATIADTSAVSINKLKEGVYDISKATGQSAETIADALYECISSNVDTQNALSVTEQAAKLAKVGFTDCATSVDILTTILNSYGDAAGTASSISDKLILTQNLGKVTVDELGSSFGKVAGLASQAGLSLDEVLAVIATLTQNGIAGSEAVTSLKAAISNIIKPTDAATELASKLGIQFNATSLSSKGLSGFLEDVQRKCRGNTEKMAELFGSTEALNAMLVLTGSGADTFANALTDISSASGTTEQALDSYSSTGTRFNASTNALKTSLIQLGDALSPIIDFIGIFFTVLSNIPTPIYLIIGALAAATLAIKGIAVAQAALTTIQTAATAVMAVFGGTAALTTASLTPMLLIIVAIVAAIGLLIGGVVSVKKAMEEAKTSAGSLISSASSVTTSMQNASSKSVGYNASGTNYFNGGETWVGEAGPEKIRLPKGTQILSNRDSMQQSGTNNYYFTVEARTIKEINDMYNLVKQEQMARRRL